MTFCIDQSAPTGAPGLPRKPDGTVWNYNTKYRGAEDCTTIIALGFVGASVAEMAAALEIGKVTLKKWTTTFEEFGEAFGYALALSEAWWQKRGQSNLEYTEEKGGPKHGFRSEVWKMRLESEYDAMDGNAKAKELEGHALAELGRQKMLEIKEREQARFALSAQANQEDINA